MSYEFIQNGQNVDFLWVDMEFTGLDIEDDVIIEIGAVATSGLFEAKDQFTAFIEHDRAELSMLLHRNPWWNHRPEHKNLMLEASLLDGRELSKIDSELSAFALDNRRPGSSLHVAGNSIHNDRKWIDRDLPELSSLLHYRMLDVSSLKLIVASTLRVSFVKEERHRALDDIYESMAELEALLHLLGAES